MNNQYNNHENGAGNQDQKVKVDAGAFGHKYQSKAEVYRFLSHDCGAYLPSYDTVTIWHLRDLMAGKRMRIKQTLVQHIQVPRFDGLKIQTMLSWCAGMPEVMHALPLIEREREKLPRQYVANVIFTIAKDSFRTWVNRLVNERHEERRNQEDTIMMDKEIADIFHASTAISVVKGNSHQLLKAGAKRRRGKDEIRQSKLETERREQEVAEKLAQFEQMQIQVQQLQQQQMNQPLPHEVQQQLQMQQDANSAIQQLKSTGLLKFGQNQEFIIPKTVTEQMAFVEQNNLEEREALQLELQNRQLALHANSAERQRASQQLEPNQEMQEYLANQINSSSGLRDSVVLLDHLEASSLSQGLEQIQPRNQGVANEGQNQAQSNQNQFKI